MEKWQAISPSRRSSRTAAGGNNGETPIFGEPLPDVTERTNRLNSAIHLANRKVFDMAEANPEQRVWARRLLRPGLMGKGFPLRRR